MFRVDPACQRASLVPRAAGHLSPQDHDFLELTSNRTIWILQLRSVHEQEDAQRWRRYMFDELIDALEISSLQMWRGRSLHALVPSTRSGISHITASRVLQIWECLEPNGRSVCFRVSTDAGEHLVSAHGTRLGRETKVRELWARSGAESHRPSVSNINAFAMSDAAASNRQST